MNIVSLLNFEEGYSEKPYYCSAGYPTIGIGKRIGPKGAPLSNYQFTASKQLAAVWLSEELQQKVADMSTHANITAAMVACNDARKSILISMAYQIGADGLAKFTNTLKAVADQRWNDAANGMLNSAWAKQTPNRAKRHAKQMLTGEWSPEYK